MGTYASAALATIAKGYLVRPESRARWDGTLEVASWPSVTYSAPLGFSAGTGKDLGILSSLAFSHDPTFAPIAQINFIEGILYEITGEECLVTLGLREFKPEILAQALPGTLVNFGSPLEALIRFGGAGAAFKEAPLVIEFTNAYSGLPTSGGVESRVSGGILTLYKTILESGFPWSAITAGEITSAELVFRALQDTSRARTNRLGNLYLY